MNEYEGSRRLTPWTTGKFYSTFKRHYSNPDLEPKFSEDNVENIKKEALRERGQGWAGVVAAKHVNLMSEVSGLKPPIKLSAEEKGSVAGSSLRLLKDILAGKYEKQDRKRLRYLTGYAIDGLSLTGNFHTSKVANKLLDQIGKKNKDLGKAVIENRREIYRPFHPRVIRG